MEPLYKGQVGVFYIQWSLSTRDKLGCSIYSGASLQGTSWGVLYTVEPLYKGQVVINSSIGDSTLWAYREMYIHTLAIEATHFPPMHSIMPHLGVYSWKEMRHIPGNIDFSSSIYGTC